MAPHGQWAEAEWWQWAEAEWHNVAEAKAKEAFESASGNGKFNFEMQFCKPRKK